MDLNPRTPKRLFAVRIPEVTEAAPDPAYEVNKVAMPPEMGESLDGQLSLDFVPEDDTTPAEVDPELQEQFTAWLDEQELLAQAAARALTEPPAAEYFTRDCPLPTCQAQARVPKAGDSGDVLGIGMSIGSATLLENMLTEHLEGHTLAEWIAALAYYQGSPGVVPAAGVVYPDGVTPGAGHRDPARQALVDAMDARLGGKRPTAQSNPADIKAFDDAQRANREARRAFAANLRSTIPKWSADQGEGVVGMKR